MNQYSDILKQAQQMQAKLAEAQNRLSSMEIDGSSGAGMVTVTISGLGNLLKVNIDKSLLSPDESDIISDLIVAAYNEAKSKMETIAQSEMSFGGMLPPGFKLPF